MSKVDREFIAIMTAGFVALVVIVGFVIWSFVGMDNYYEQQQNKQEACLKAGGMYIDNKDTEPYCFFNK